MMHNNDGRMMEERKDMERGMDFRTDLDAPMALDGGNHHPPGRSARNDTNAADDVQRLFSPRSTAAMALSSISQTFSMGSETAYESKSNDSSNGSDPSQENDERLPFLPSVATTKMSAPPPQSHAYRCVTEPSPSTARHHYYPHHQPPPYSSSPAMHYAAPSELNHKNDKHHAPPYSTPDVNMQLERSFSASSDPMTRARSHVKPPANYQSYHQPQFTPSLPPKSDGSRRAPSHYPPNDPYHPRMVSWNNADPATMQWMPYPHHHQPHPSLMLYPCYSMPQPTNVPHGSFPGMIAAPVGSRLPPTPIQSYVTPTPHKKLKLVGDAPPSLPYQVVPQAPPPTYSSVKAPSPPSRTDLVEVQPVEEKYNRKNKSLGVLAETFLKHFTDSGVGHEIIIDQLAAELAVERRRIYDVVNILEALQVVVKMGKNTYHWMGREHLVRQFALLQHDGIGIWPEHAAKSGLYQSTSSNSTEGSDKGNTNVAETVRNPMEYKIGECGGGSKSLTRLSQMFLQIFLVGVEPVSLPQASDLIHGKASSPAELVELGMKPGESYPTDPKIYQQVATRGLKTKIRRLYDIANVFLSIGLLRKSEYRRTSCPDGKRPQYHFQYHMSLQAIREAYDQLPASMIENQSAFSEQQLRILQVSGTNNQSINFFCEPPTTESAATADSSLPLENTSPSPEPRFDFCSEHRQDSTYEPPSATEDARSAVAESPNSVSSVKIVAEEESSAVVGPMQSTPLTTVDETRTAQNIQVTPSEEAGRSSPDQDEPCFQALHVLGARPNDTSPRRVSLSTSSSSL